MRTADRAASFCRPSSGETDPDTAIIVLDDGRVREIGRHDELLAKPGSLYAKLYSMQLFDRDLADPEADVQSEAPSPIGRHA